MRAVDRSSLYAASSLEVITSAQAFGICATTVPPRDSVAEEDVVSPRV